MKSFAFLLFFGILPVYSQQDSSRIVQSKTTDILAPYDPFRDGTCYAIEKKYRLNGELKQVVFDDWNGYRAWVCYTFKGERKSYEFKYNPSWARNLHPPCDNLIEPLSPDGI